MNPEESQLPGAGREGVNALPFQPRLSTIFAHNSLIDKGAALSKITPPLHMTDIEQAPRRGSLRLPGKTTTKVSRFESRQL
jgi:hypothetical protein